VTLVFWIVFLIWHVDLTKNVWCRVSVQCASTTSQDKVDINEMQNCQKRNDANVAVLLKKHSCTLRTPRKIPIDVKIPLKTVADVNDL